MPDNEEGLDRMDALTTFIRSLLGSSLLGIPFAVKEAGMVAGITGMLLLGAAATYGCMILLECRARMVQDSPDRTAIDFCDVGQEAYGVECSRLIHSLLFLSQFGECCTYIVFIGVNLVGEYCLPSTVCPRLFALS